MAPIDTVTFDLRALSSSTRNFASLARGVALIVGSVGVFIIFLVAVIVLVNGRALWDFSLADPSWYFLWVMLAGGLFVLSLAFWGAVVRGGRPADMLVVNGDGIILRWSNGRESHIHWTARGFRWECQASDDRTESFVTPRLRPSSRVPYQALEALLAAAQIHNLRIIETRWSSRLGRGGPLWILQPQGTAR
jgi:hypothetical protein